MQWLATLLQRFRKPGVALLVGRGFVASCLRRAVKRLPKPCGRGGMTMLRVVRYLVILLLDVVLATHNPRRIRFACTNEPTPRPATARNCRVWSRRKRTFLLLLAAPDSQRESMLECGNQKQLKPLGFNRILDPYSIGTEKAQNILQVAENKGWLPTLDAFRTFAA